MNLRDVKEGDVPAPLISYADANGTPRQGGSWAGFGYEGSMADRALGTDSPVALKFLIDGGAIDKTTKMFFGDPIRRYCTKNGKAACAELLAKLGFPE